MALAGFEVGEYLLGYLLEGRAIRSLRLALLAAFLTAILQRVLAQGAGLAQLRRHLAGLRCADMRKAAQPHEVGAAVDLKAKGPAAATLAHAQEQPTAVMYPSLVRQVFARCDPPQC